MYESVKESVNAYNNDKKAKETPEDRLVFKWKFIVIGLGVLLIILIGGLSQILKEISDRKVNRYDTTFIYSLLQQTDFLKTTESMEYFLHGLNASSAIVFDSAELLFRTNTPNVTLIMDTIAEHDNLLWFMKVNDGIADHNFGLYLSKALPKVDENSELNIAESRNHKQSAIYSLDQPSHYRLNNSDDCFLYKYSSSQKTLQLVQLLKLREGEINSQINATLIKSRCYGNSETDAIDNIFRLTGLVVKTTPTTTFLRQLQIYKLQMKHEEVIA